MAKKKQILNKTQVYQGLAYDNFTHITSNTIFSLGSFVITSNFDNYNTLHDGSKLKSFTKPITLQTINISETDSEILYNKFDKIILNSDNSDINNFVRFGSAYEFLRITLQNIILNYPASIFINSTKQNVSTYTINDFKYDSIKDESTFHVYANTIDNVFGLIYTSGNTDTSDGELKNLNVSYDQYVMWSEYLPDSVFNVIGFTGSTPTSNLFFKIKGNPISFNSASTSGTTFLNISFHIKPNNHQFELFRESLRDYEKYLLNERDGYNGFRFQIKKPILTENGDVLYNTTKLTWTTTDKYNIDINTSSYRRFLEAFLNIGLIYDQVKTDLVNRILTTTSLKTYDSTDEGKMTKLLRIYGREFDKIRELIDSLLYVNTVTYNKKNNIPDALIYNLVSLFGWEYQSIIDDSISKTPFNIDDNERNRNTDLLPSEINIELWRRILINTNYFWKTKGSREAIKTMFLMLGIPEEFINITEYVYTVDEKINPQTLSISTSDFISIPYDSDGYPIQISGNTKYYYFHMNGDSDGGEKYLNEYRKAGFKLNKIIDNRKSWSDNDLSRSYSITPEYILNDDKLLINTKEIDIALEASRGLEYDVYNYYSGYTDNTLLNFYKFISDNYNNISIEDIKTSNFYPSLIYKLSNYYVDSQNKYTYDELFNYLSLYDAYFNKFIGNLIPSTIIQNNVGISIKNPSFLRQKFEYKRGVYFPSGTTTVDLNNINGVRTLVTIEGKVNLGNNNPIYVRRLV